MAKSGNLISNANTIKAGDGLPISIPSNFSTQDATPSSPKTSPLTVSTSIITLVVPDNALFITFFPTGSNAFRVSESSSVSNYFVISNTLTSLVQLPVGSQQNLYLLRDGASDATAQFLFYLV